MAKSRCCVPHCIYYAEDNGSYHQIPSSVHVRKLWLRLLQLDEADVGDYSVVCSYHFTSDCYLSGPKRKILKRTAIPLPISSEVAVTLSDINPTTIKDTAEVDPLRIERPSDPGADPLSRSSDFRLPDKSSIGSNGADALDAFLNYLGAKLKRIDDPKLRDKAEADILGIVRRHSGQVESDVDEGKQTVVMKRDECVDLIEREHSYVSRSSN